MARYVTISTFGPSHPQYSDVKNADKVDYMINFWNGQLQKAWPDKPDLIVLPETCDIITGLPPEKLSAYYKERGEQLKEFFQAQARKHNCNICYSAYRDMPDGTRRNSSQIINRNGKVVGIYNKNFPVIHEITERNVRSGKDTLLIETDFGKVACVICFDLNFDELKTRTAEMKPDLILFSSEYHGGLRQACWAYDCQAHFVGAVVNLPCQIISPDGRTLASSTNYFKHVTHTVNLDCKLVHLDGNWEKLTALKTEYGRNVDISDPGHLGAVLLTSNCQDRSIDDLITEFEIETLDQYLQRSRDFDRIPENIE